MPIKKYFANRDSKHPKHTSSISNTLYILLYFLYIPCFSEEFKEMIYSAKT